MNKIIAISILILSVFLLCSCSSQIMNIESESPAVTEPVVTAEPTPTPTPEPTPIPDILVLTADDLPDIEIERVAGQVELSSAYTNSMLEAADLFTELRKITITDTDLTLDQIEALRAAFPRAILSYNVNILGAVYPSNTTEFRFTDSQVSSFSEICGELQKFPALSYIDLMNDDGSTGYDFEQASTLQSLFPGAFVNMNIDLLGQRVSFNAERIEYVKVDLGNAAVDTLRSCIPMFPNLNYLLLDSCNIDYELLAQLRDEFPDVKIVWRVYFSSGKDGYNCLTDTEKVWATGSVTDAYTDPLKYCTEVKYMDLGHNCITNINFVNYMPKLEVLVIAITWVCDISPLANCPNLEYLECFSAKDEAGHCLSDLRPLSNCTNLRHLNISNLYALTDISPLYDLPNLERVYCTMSNIPQAQQDKIRELHPDCEFNFTWTDPSKGPWRWEDDAMTIRVPRYELLAQQMGYDTWEYSK